MPSKIVAVGLNYVDHAKELKMEIPKNPIMFIKPASTVVGPEDPIIYPETSNQVDYEV
jgi:2-keto-4-pentenoate hydratase/2-oxohepta-3-ene-1,7-dioic acid hydratase in catechol pathway